MMTARQLAVALLQAQQEIGYDVPVEVWAPLDDREQPVPEFEADTVEIKLRGLIWPRRIIVIRGRS